MNGLLWDHAIADDPQHRSSRCFKIGHPTWREAHHPFGELGDDSPPLVRERGGGAGLVLPADNSFFIFPQVVPGGNALVVGGAWFPLMSSARSGSVRPDAYGLLDRTAAVRPPRPSDAVGVGSKQEEARSLVGRSDGGSRESSPPSHIPEAGKIMGDLIESASSELGDVFEDHP